MKYDLFNHLREGLPKMEVEIWGVTTSNYKNEPIKVAIGELNECNVSKTTQ